MSDQQTDVPIKVFESFLNALGEAGISPEIINRLKKTLLEEHKLGDRALKSALFPDEPSQ